MVNYVYYTTTLLKKDNRFTYFSFLDDRRAYHTSIPSPSFLLNTDH